jgi:hypothetical protein
MRVVQAAALVVGGALLAEIGILACSQKSYSDTSADDAGDASRDDTGSSIGVDLSDGGSLDVFEVFETSTLAGDGGPCAIPSGTYTVTATPTEDSGPQCPAWTSTVIPPGPSPVTGPPITGPCLGGPGTGSWQSDGPLPVCALDFTCSNDDGANTIVIVGSVEVFDGTYAGTAESQVYSDLDASVALYTCTFHLDYTLQQ